MKKRRIKTSTLANKVLSNDDFNERGVLGRKSAWDSLQKREEKKFEDFSKRYFQSLNNKFIRDRVDYIEKTLKRNRYRSIEDISGDDIEGSMQSENGSSRKFRPGQKFYVKFQDTMIVAIQFGRCPIEQGANIGAAHIDSPGIVGRIKKLKEGYNICYMPATIRGGVDPKDFVNHPMSMFFHGVVKDRLKKEVLVSFSMGERNGEPKVFFPEESAHLGDSEGVSVSQLEAILGNIPYHDKKFNKDKRVTLNVMKELNKKYNLTEYALENGQVWFLPSQKPEWIGADKSMISAYGQDNWANAFPLLHGFLNAKSPEYTKIAIFYDKEEIGDAGRGSLKTNFFSEVITPTLAYLVKKDIADHYRMLRNSWSLFSDVTEAIHSFSPDKHDIKDSAYLGSGVVITPFSGEVGNMGGYESSPEMIHAIRDIFNEKKVAHQMGIMGSQEEITAQSSNTFHQDLFTNGIDFGVPVFSMHRTNELTSRIDLWNMVKAVTAYYSVYDHNAHLPQYRK